MSRVIYFRLGDKDRIPLGTFLAMLRSVKGLLADFDAAVSRDPLGSIRWDVAILEKHSPTVLGVVGQPYQRRDLPPPPPGFEERIEDALIESTARLSLNAVRSNLVSDSALERFRTLAQKSTKVGEVAVYTEKREVPINEQTLDNIKQLTVAKSKSTGSILGSLDTISVHRANEIRVWDENTKRPVRCRYPDALEETIKSLLRERVLVSGVVSFNPFGQATVVDVATIQRYPRVDELPTIDDVLGMVDDVTGGESLSAYLEHLRDG